MKFSISILIIIFFFGACSSPGPEMHSPKYEARFIETEEFANLNLPFSQAVRLGNMLYLSGQIGDLQETGELIKGGIVPETRQTMLNIKEVLEQNGSSLDEVIKCTCMLADISEWALMSAEYIKFFPNHKPARSAFGTTGLALNARVEIECLAYVKTDNQH